MDHRSTSPDEFDLRRLSQQHLELLRTLNIRGAPQRSTQPHGGVDEDDDGTVADSMFFASNSVAGRHVGSNRGEPDYSSRVIVAMVLPVVCIVGLGGTTTLGCALLAGVVAYICDFLGSRSSSLIAVWSGVIAVQLLLSMRAVSFGRQGAWTGVFALLAAAGLAATLGGFITLQHRWLRFQLPTMALLGERICFTSLPLLGSALSAWAVAVGWWSAPHRTPAVLAVLLAAHYPWFGLPMDSTVRSPGPAGALDRAALGRVQLAVLTLLTVIMPPALYAMTCIGGDDDGSGSGGGRGGALASLLHLSGLLVLPFSPAGRLHLLNLAALAALPALMVFRHRTASLRWLSRHTADRSAEPLPSWLSGVLTLSQAAGVAVLLLWLEVAVIFDTYAAAIIMPRPSSYYVVGLALWAGAAASALAMQHRSGLPAAVLAAVSACCGSLALGAPKRVAFLLAPLPVAGLVFMLTVLGGRQGSAGGGRPLPSPPSSFSVLLVCVAAGSVLGCSVLTGHMAGNVMREAELSTACQQCQWVSALPQLAGAVAGGAGGALAAALVLPSWPSAAALMALLMAGALALAEQALRAVSAAGERGDLSAAVDPDEAESMAHVYPPVMVCVTSLAVLFVASWQRRLARPAASTSWLSGSLVLRLVVSIAMGKLVLMQSDVASSGPGVLGRAVCLVALGELIRFGTGSSWASWAAAGLAGYLMLWNAEATRHLLGLLVQAIVPAARHNTGLLVALSAGLWAALCLPLAVRKTLDPGTGRVRRRRTGRLRSLLVSIMVMTAFIVAVQPELGLLPYHHHHGQGLPLAAGPAASVSPVRLGLAGLMMVMLARFGRPLHPLVRGALAGVLAGFAFWLAAMPVLPANQPGGARLWATCAVFIGTALTGSVAGSLVPWLFSSAPASSGKTPPSRVLALVYAVCASFVGPAMISSVCRVYDAGSLLDEARATDATSATGYSARKVSQAVVSAANAEQAWLAMLGLAALCHALVALAAKMALSHYLREMQRQLLDHGEPHRPASSSPSLVRTERVDVADVRATFVRPVHDRQHAAAGQRHGAHTVLPLPAWLPMAGNFSTVFAVCLALVIHVRHLGGTEVGAVPLAPLLLLLEQDSFLFAWLTPARRYVPVVLMPLLALLASSIYYAVMAPGGGDAAAAASAAGVAGGEEDWSVLLYNCALLACALPAAIGIARWAWRGVGSVHGEKRDEDVGHQNTAAASSNRRRMFAHDQEELHSGGAGQGGTPAKSVYSGGGLLRQRVLSAVTSPLSTAGLGRAGGPSSAPPLTSPLAGGSTRINAAGGATGKGKGGASAPSQSLLRLAPLCLLPVLLADIYPIRVLGAISLLATIVQHVIEQRRTRRSLLLL